MKFKIFFMLTLAVLLAGNTIAAEKKSSAAPTAFIAQPDFIFGPVVDGTQVVHDYVIQNRGAEILEIQKVKTG